MVILLTFTVWDGGEWDGDGDAEIKVNKIEPREPMMTDMNRWVRLTWSSVSWADRRREGKEATCGGTAMEGVWESKGTEKAVHKETGPAPWPVSGGRGCMETRREWASKSEFVLCIIENWPSSEEHSVGKETQRSCVSGEVPMEGPWRWDWEMGLTWLKGTCRRVESHEEQMRDGTTGLWKPDRRSQNSVIYII